MLLLLISLLKMLTASKPYQIAISSVDYVTFTRSDLSPTISIFHVTFLTRLVFTPKLTLILLILLQHSCLSAAH